MEKRNKQSNVQIFYGYNIHYIIIRSLTTYFASIFRQRLQTHYSQQQQQQQQQRSSHHNESTRTAKESISIQDFMKKKCY
ncbi:unnamed protein product [Adineta steineri]|uniref:Uncharacterized protein n=1 Tax=Adineta steineri TaxID=433720 RepID=A0A815W5N3_9BILA|nr:unnamed protein product [Adineta steineri]